MITAGRGTRQVILDLETGGLDPERNAITEIGAVAFMEENGRLIEVDAYHRFVIPGINLTVSARAARVQGMTVSQIYDRRGAEAECDALRDLIVFIAKHVPNPNAPEFTGTIWAQYAHFDNGFLHNMLKRNQSGTPVIFTERNSMACTRELAKMLRGRGLLNCFSTSLDGLLEHFGLMAEKESRANGHSALGDARLTLLVLERLLKVAGWLEEDR